MKRPVEFYSEGFKLCGDVYIPDDVRPGEQRAAVLLCHGYTGVKARFSRSKQRSGTFDDLTITLSRTL